MDKTREITNGLEPDIQEIEAMHPMDEADPAEIAEAAAEQVVVAKPKRGLGLAALFTRKKRDDEPATAPDEQAGPDTVSEAIIAQVDEADEEEAPALHRNGQLKSVLECMLFVSDGPLTAKDLAGTLEIDEETVTVALNELEEQLDSSGGIKLMRIAGGYQLCTKPEYADYCTMLLQPAKKRLSKAALETLAVVAYRQPCTMPEVEAVRGVAVDGVMRTLAERGLVKEAGRKQTPGRPILYATTPEFLEYFGLNDLSELPDIDMLAVEEVKALEAQRELFAGEQAEDDTGRDLQTGQPD